MLGLEWNLHLCYFICEDISILNHLILLGFFFLNYLYQIFCILIIICNSLLVSSVNNICTILKKKKEYHLNLNTKSIVTIL